MFIVFDDVEYAELAFRDAQNLVMFYRQQSHLIKENFRNNNKRKKKDYHRSKKFKLNNNLHSYDVHLSSDRYFSRSKRNHRCYSTMSSFRRNFFLFFLSKSFRFFLIFRSLFKVIKTRNYFFLTVLIYLIYSSIHPMLFS